MITVLAQHSVPGADALAAHQGPEGSERIGAAERLRHRCLIGQDQPAYPRTNKRPIAERWISSARPECLDRVVITGKRHLRLVLGEYAAHYNLQLVHAKRERS